MSRRQDAIAVLRARLAGISIAGGYQTDAGQLVFLAENPTTGPDDLRAAIAIVVGDDSPVFANGKILVTLPIEAQALVQAANLDDPWAMVEACISDIKTAVETDHDLAGTLQTQGLQRGSTKPLKREEGATYVGAAVAYTLLYQETWGQP